MESQPRPKSGSSERSSNESQGSKKESPQRSERSGSERSTDSNEGSQRPRMKYGSRPPEYLSSDAEVSQWILKAEEEERRIAAAQLAEERRIRAEQLQLYGLKPSPSKQPDSDVLPLCHRGCKYRLPSADPIPIPTIPYDPLDKRWLHQELRRHRSCLVRKAPNKALKKNIKVLCELAEAGFDVPFSNDLVDDSDDGEFDELLLCPICSTSPEIVVTAVTGEIEVTADQVIKMAVDQEIDVAVGTEIEVAEDAVAIMTPTNPVPQASTTVNKIKSYVQNVLKFRRTIV